MVDKAKQDEAIREMNASYAAQKGFAEEAKFDNNEALHEMGDASGDRKIDEDIRKLNESYAAQEGFVAEENFDAREARFDAEQQ